MKQETLWITGIMAICSIANQGVGAETLEDIIGARDSVLIDRLPRTFEGMSFLTLQADRQETPITFSFEDDKNKGFGLSDLSDEERGLLVNVYGLEREITFLSDGIVIYPSGWTKHLKTKSEDVAKTINPVLFKGIQDLSSQADREKKSTVLFFKNDEGVDFGFANLSEEKRNMLISEYKSERTITFLPDRIVVHPHRQIEKKLKAQFANGGAGFFLRLGASRKS